MQFSAAPAMPLPAALVAGLSATAFGYSAHADTNRETESRQGPPSFHGVAVDQRMGDYGAQDDADAIIQFFGDHDLFDEVLGPAGNNSQHPPSRG